MARTKDQGISYHAARVLLLVDSFSKGAKGKIEGLTKIAKLDFLLRYPIFLERLLVLRGISWTPGTEPTSAERNSVESRMVRYKFGPWDDRYYTIIGVLIGKGLVEPVKGKGRVNLRITNEGREVAKSFRSSGWEREFERCRLLYKHFNKSGSGLMRTIYKEFEAELNIQLGEDIS